MTMKTLVSLGRSAVLFFGLIIWAINDPDLRQSFMALAQAQSASVINLKIGDTLPIPEDRSTLTLVAIAEDSRCPANMHCMQEGQVSADFKLTRRDKPEGISFRLILKAAQPQLSSKYIYGYIIKLVKVEPVLKAGTAIANDEYTLSLLIGRQ